MARLFPNRTASKSTAVLVAQSGTVAIRLNDGNVSGTRPELAVRTCFGNDPGSITAVTTPAILGGYGAASYTPTRLYDRPSAPPRTSTSTSVPEKRGGSDDLDGGASPSPPPHDPPRPGSELSTKRTKTGLESRETLRRLEKQVLLDELEGDVAYILEDIKALYKEINQGCGLG
ncbi:hypothetical protein F4801DRAFT_575978 [Xylaria longipes]|nr:hypothetical protein F4801DRAFT_575978 [Xylaria longipes]